MVVRMHWSFEPSGVPASWQQRLEITSFTFMLNLVPLPVIQTWERKLIWMLPPPGFRRRSARSAHADGHQTDRWRVDMGCAFFSTTSAHHLP